MQIWHTLKLLAYGDIHDEIFYDGALLSNICQHVWELWGAKEPPSNMVPPQSNIEVDLWHVLPITGTEQEEQMQEEETHNSPETSKDDWRHSTPRPPEVVEIPRYNNAGIEYNEKIGPPPEGPKGEKLPEPPEGEDATLEASDPRKDNWPPHWGG